MAVVLVAAGTCLYVRHGHGLEEQVERADEASEPAASAPPA